MFNINYTQWMIIKCVIGLSLFFAVGEFLTDNKSSNLRQAKAEAFSIRTCNSADDVYEIDYGSRVVIITCTDGLTGAEYYSNIHGEDVREILLKGK